MKHIKLFEDEYTEFGKEFFKPLTEKEKIEVRAKIDLLKFLNATYDYPKEFKEYHEAYIRELEEKLKRK